MKDQTVRRKERTDRRRERTGPLALLHDVTHTHTETHTHTRKHTETHTHTNLKPIPEWFSSWVLLTHSQEFNLTACVCITLCFCLFICILVYVYKCMCASWCVCVCVCVVVYLWSRSPCLPPSEKHRGRLRSPRWSSWVTDKQQTFNLTDQIKNYICNKVCLHLFVLWVSLLCLSYKHIRHETEQNAPMSLHFSVLISGSWAADWHQATEHLVPNHDDWLAKKLSSNYVTK